MKTNKDNLRIVARGALWGLQRRQTARSRWVLLEVYSDLDEANEAMELTAKGDLKWE